MIFFLFILLIFIFNWSEMHSFIIYWIVILVLLLLLLCVRVWCFSTDILRIYIHNQNIIDNHTLHLNVYFTKYTALIIKLKRNETTTTKICEFYIKCKFHITSKHLAETSNQSSIHNTFFCNQKLNSHYKFLHFFFKINILFCYFSYFTYCVFLLVLVFIRFTF